MILNFNKIGIFHGELTLKSKNHIEKAKIECHLTGIFSIISCSNSFALQKY